MPNEEFEKWATGFDHESRDWLDMGNDKVFAAGYECRQPEIDALKAEIKHWKANHQNMVDRARALIDRPDLPLERVKAFHQIERLNAENERLRNAAKPVIDYWFEEDESRTHEDDNKAFLELSRAYYKRDAAMMKETK